MKLAIVGSRDFADQAMVERFVQTLPLDWVVVSGDGFGPDRWAVAAAQARGMATIVHPPNTRIYHPKQAPKMRNKLIVRDADALVDFWNGASTGTLDAAMLAVQQRKPILLVRAQDPLPAVECLRK